jgi:hypothetical protein
MAQEPIELHVTGMVEDGEELPERLLRRIDECAKNRSAFLARAAEKALAES